MTEFISSEPTLAPEAPVKARELEGRRVAVIVADGFEQSEFDGPVQALRAAGARVDVVAEDAPHLGHIHGVKHFDPAPGTKADRLLSDVDVADYDALLVPGGLASPDHMRQSEAHLKLVAAFIDADKPTALICHGPWLLADSDRAKGRTVTSWPAIRRDLERAGARWRDDEVVVDGNLVTSRKPEDVQPFSKALISLIAELAPR
ncbi:MAG: putative protease [Cyanobacteria bacterium RYN_339]|nr:putative protease [Cyanobacteria bacterium RYN_339]